MYGICLKIGRDGGTEFRSQAMWTQWHLRRLVRKGSAAETTAASALTASVADNLRAAFTQGKDSG